MGSALLLGIGSVMVSHRTEFVNKDPHIVTIAKSYMENKRCQEEAKHTLPGPLEKKRKKKKRAGSAI